MAYIGFGANLGDRRAKFDAALEALNLMPATTVRGHSRLYETEPEGLTDGGQNFLNAAIAVETDLAPADLMSAIRDVELRLGKSRGHRSDLSRVIDLDLLLYANKQVKEGSLEVPHPRMHRRAFVLAPLAEIAPEAVHPVLGSTVRDLLGLLSREDTEKAQPIVDCPSGPERRTK
ncbi:MAG: 2-amino-4-hydroxy-6-hydroxymethyldihydropteridine diphosphokinase [Desulfomonile tiedjei]|nr:2-amino-4-hydroxy-6-hydroxymethyldihydropteridine diphosphokinase [Desulfomonile tiedjei]